MLLREFVIQDEGGRGIGFDDCKKLRKVIHNKKLAISVLVSK